MEWIPTENLGKRVASASLDRPQKKQADVQSMGSVASEGLPEEAWGARAQPGQGSSQKQPTRSPNTSMTAGQGVGTLQDYMLTLLLQCPPRLRDLEAINYYTHVVPTQAPIYKALDEIYQGSLYTVSQNKEHKLGPPMIHRGKALLDQVVGAEEALKEKENLKAMWPVVREVLESLNNETMDIDEAANIIGHCKMYAMYDKSLVRLAFVMPHIVTCNGRVTTLGSVVSRLMRSMGYECKTGVAPPWFLERQIKAAIDTKNSRGATNPGY